MQILHSCCCGLDFHKKQIVACRMFTDAGKRQKEIRSFGTMTANILSFPALARQCLMHASGN